MRRDYHNPTQPQIVLDAASALAIADFESAVRQLEEAALARNEVQVLE